MRNRQIPFSSDVNTKTGEVVNKQIQVTAYVKDGNETPFEPKACVVLKLGYDKLSLYADDYNEIERLCKDVMDFITEIKEEGNQTVVEEKRNYSEALKTRSDEIKNAGTG